MDKIWKLAALMIICLISSCDSDDDSGVLLDEPGQEAETLNAWDYCHSDGSIRKFLWIDNTFFISSDKERHLTDSYLRTRGVDIERRYRSGRFPAYNTLEGGRHWTFIGTTETSGIRTLEDMRRALDNDSIYVSPTLLVPNTLSDDPADGISACDRTMTISCREGKRTEFIRLVNELGAKFGPAYGNKFTILAPPSLTPLELSNLLFDEGAVETFEPSFLSYTSNPSPY